MIALLTDYHFLLVMLAILSAGLGGWTLGWMYGRKKLYEQYAEGIWWHIRRQEVIEIERRKA